MATNNVPTHVNQWNSKAIYDGTKMFRTNVRRIQDGTSMNQIIRDDEGTPLAPHEIPGPHGPWYVSNPKANIAAANITKLSTDGKLKSDPESLSRRLVASLQNQGETKAWRRGIDHCFKEMGGGTTHQVGTDFPKDSRVINIHTLTKGFIVDVKADRYVVRWDNSTVLTDVPKFNNPLTKIRVVYLSSIICQDYTV